MYEVTASFPDKPAFGPVTFHSIADLITYLTRIPGDLKADEVFTVDLRINIRPEV